MQRNVFLMNCGQCLTLEELRFVMTNDFRVIKEDFENFTETNISNATDVTGVSDISDVSDVIAGEKEPEIIPEEISTTIDTPDVIQEEEVTSDVSISEELQNQDMRSIFQATIVRNAHSNATSSSVETQTETEQPPQRPICCICQEECLVSCHPENCHTSHTMCYPECVSKYAYIMRIQQGRVSCGHCRNEFHNVVVNGNVVPIPELSDVTRQMLPSHLRNDRGCDRCWGIYNPIPSPEYFYHNKRVGHRGRHRTMPLQYQQIVEVTEGAERNEDN